MQSKILNQDSFDGIVSLDEARSHCRLMPDQTFDDPELLRLIQTACELAQTYCNRLLTPGTVIVEYGPGEQGGYLQYGDVVENSLAVAVDGLSVDKSQYFYLPIAQKITILPLFTHSATVTYDCGMQNVPTVIRQAILLMVGTWYANHEDYAVGSGVSVSKLPLAVTTLLDGERYYASI